MANIRRLLIIFVAAFLLNFTWEHAHAVLYLHYRGQEITNAILARAALFDAIFTTTLALPFLLVPFLKQRFWIAIFTAFVFSVGLELTALSTGRWAYTSAMPLVPILGVGVTPSVQLALLAFISYRLAQSIEGSYT